MAGSASDYLEKKLIDHILGGGSPAGTYTSPPTLFFTPPVTLYAALFTAAPSDTGGGTEVTGGSYVRATITNNSTNWPAATGATAAKSNGTAIVFAQATANWGTLVAFALFDASSAGNMLFWADISPTKTIQTNDTAQFAIGDLTFTAD